VPVHIFRWFSEFGFHIYRSEMDMEENGFGFSMPALCLRSFDRPVPDGFDDHVPAVRAGDSGSRITARGADHGGAGRFGHFAG
jgi:hypothetical protein